MVLLFAVRRQCKASINVMSSSCHSLAPGEVVNVNVNIADGSSSCHRPSWSLGRSFCNSFEHALHFQTASRHQQTERRRMRPSKSLQIAVVTFPLVFLAYSYRSNTVMTSEEAAPTGARGGLFGAGGRFKGGTDPIMEKFNESLSFDKR